MRLGDETVLVDDVGDAAGVLVAGARGCAVGEADLVVDVTQQRIREMELLGKAGVLLGGIEADPENPRVLRRVLFVEVPEPGTLDRSARCVSLRVEPEHYLAAAQTGEADLPALVVADFEIRRDVSNLQHRCTSEQ